MKIKMIGFGGESSPLSHYFPSRAARYGRRRWALRGALSRCRGDRTNGNTRDIERLQSKKMPGDGRYKWTKGEERADGWVCGQRRSDGLYDYEVEYTAGPKDVEWFCQIDCNYLSRLERAGNLQEKEPKVWALRELDRARRGKNVHDIRAWWRSYIFPNGQIYDDVALRKRLDTALSIYIGKLLAADIVRCLPQSAKNFELGVLNIIRGYLGLRVIRSNDEQLLQLPLAVSRASTSERVLFSPEYYERKDRKTAEVAKKQKRESTIVTNRDKSPCVIM